jgi:hypothetical protein
MINGSADGLKPGAYGMEVLVTGGNVRCSSICGRSQDQTMVFTTSDISSDRTAWSCPPRRLCETFGTAFKFERGCQSSTLEHGTVTPGR